MKTLITTSLAALAGVMLLSPSAMAAEAGELKDANEIVERTNTAQYYAAKDGRALQVLKMRMMRVSTPFWA